MSRYFNPNNLKDDPAPEPQICRECKKRLAEEAKPSAELQDAVEQELLSSFEESLQEPPVEDVGELRAQLTVFIHDHPSGDLSASLAADKGITFGQVHVAAAFLMSLVARRSDEGYERALELLVEEAMTFKDKEPGGTD